MPQTPIVPITETTVKNTVTSTIAAVLHDPRRSAVTRKMAVRANVKTSRVVATM